MRSAPTDSISAVCQGLEELDFGPDSSVLIVGLGKTGFSIACFLAEQGLRFAVTDSRDEPPLLRDFREAFPDAAVFLGGFQSSTFEAATHVVVSPGVALSEPPIRAACERGQPVIGDLDLFACMARAPVIAITGSNGKSTVTTLVGMMGAADGREIRVGGNLGTPMLELLDDSASLYVLELSSFQLESSHLLDPLAATVLNISPDHMDRYPDLPTYAAAKKRIFHGNGLMVLNADDAMVAGMAETGRRKVWFSLETPSVEYGVDLVDGQEWVVAQGSPLIPVAEIKLQGRHNLANALAAVALGDAAGLSHEAMKKALREFTGLDHRAQWVAELDGVTWINDSKATNVGACMAALKGMRRPVILIAGGDGKGADFTVMRSIVADKVKSAVLMGRDAGLLQTAIGDIVDTVMAADMHEAVLAAQRLAEPGDIVLLAPACASLDQYKDYQERGRVFADEVRGLDS